MANFQKFIFLITIIIIAVACQNTSQIDVVKKEISYKRFLDKQVEILGKPNGYYKNMELTYLYDMDTISKDSFLSLDFDSVYNIFQELDFKFISIDSIIRKATLNTISKKYYKSHTFKPSFLDVTYYSDNLLGLNLGSKEHGQMKCVMYDNNTGERLAEFTKKDYKGSFFLGSMTAHDTFDQVRMVLKIDSLIYDQTFLTKDIDQRTIAEDTEK